MTGRRACVLGLVVLLVVVSVAAAAEPRPVTGEVSAVTLYRGQALVTRVVAVKCDQGMTQVVVGDLPQHIVPDSLFADADQGVQVRAVRYRTRALREEPRDEVRRIEQQIEDIEEELRANQRSQEVVKHRAAYLDKLEQFTAPTAQTELSKGVLNAGTLKELTLFAFDQRESAATDLLKLEEKERELKSAVELARRRHSELTAGSSRTLREAVVELSAERAAQADVRLNYLVTEAGWEPLYNVRATGQNAAVTVEYNATVHQMSGEDWPNVQLTLSTASPALTSQGPELGPFWVSLAGQPLVSQVVEVQDEMSESLRRSLASNAMRQRQAAHWEENEDAMWLMNAAAGGLQNLELAADKDVLRRLREPSVSEGLSVTYALPGGTTVPSRREQQMVQIVSLDLASDLYFVAVPLLTGYVYREAELLNDSELALLEGQATVYLNGGFVGRTDVPMVAVGQKFTVGLGMDSQLRAARRMVERTERVLGANKEVVASYGLTLENFKERPVNVRVYDRIPHTTKGAEIRVTLGEMSDELSDDRLYLQDERPKGILRWDIEVPAGSAGPDARRVDYGYSLEFDRKLYVVSPLGGGQAEKGGAPEQLRQEFEQFFKGQRKAH